MCCCEVWCGHFLHEEEAGLRICLNLFLELSVFEAVFGVCWKLGSVWGMLKIFIECCVVDGMQAPGVWTTLLCVFSVRWIKQYYLRLLSYTGWARDLPAWSASYEAEPYLPSYWPAGIAGMWDHVFCSWPKKGPENVIGTVMFSSHTSFMELMTDALIVRCDCCPKSIFSFLQFFTFRWRTTYWRSVLAIHLRDNMLYLCSAFSDHYPLNLCTTCDVTSAQFGQSGRSAGSLYFSVPDAVCVHSCMLISSCFGINSVVIGYGDSIATPKTYYVQIIYAHRA
jgi:hypothetical protein